MKKFFLFAAACSLLLTSCGSKANAESAAPDQDSLPVVYFIKDISPESLAKVYNALGRKAEGNNVAVKISTGESNKTNHLRPELIGDFVKSINGTLVECNTAYAGNRISTEDHYRTAREHGYMDIAKVDIMDGEGDTILPVNGGFHLTKDIVGKHFLDYDFLVVLSHFKGHQMGGFGGALKNVSIGIASSDGKSYIHTAGKCDTAEKIWQNVAEQDDFLESMADACKAVFDHMGDRVLFINVANRLSIDCDCNGNPHAPEMADLGIFASLDPVALDRACVDAVVNSDDPGKKHLIERINQMHGTHILDSAEKLGLGSQKYRLVTLE